MQYLTEALNPKHKKEDFSCGKDMLDKYLHRQAKQDVKKNLTACFVLPESETSQIKGYYTLSGDILQREDLPEAYRKKSPYDSIPATLLGRLAVGENYQGQKLGKYLLLDALKRSFEATSEVASFAVVVDPLDEGAEKFYKKYGFIKLPSTGKMFLPMKTIKKMLQ